MDRTTLAHLPVVVLVARLGRFAAAGGEAGLSPSAVSHAVRVVEAQLGTPLFTRTTRSVSLTEEGRAFLEIALPALESLDRAVEEVHQRKGRVAGILRINAPRAALPMVMSPVIAQLSRDHPELVVEVTSEDALIDIVAAGFDVGIRLGGMIADDMIAIRMTPPFSAILVAAPAYLERAGEPQSITDLLDHNCIGFKRLARGGNYDWELLDGGHDVAVAVKGTTRVTEPLLALDLALAGIGIAYLFEPFVRSHLKTGALSQVLSDAAIEEPGLFLYFSKHVRDLPKIRALIEAVRELTGRAIAARDSANT